MIHQLLRIWKSLAVHFLLFSLIPAHLFAQSQEILSVDGSNTEALGFSVSTGMDVNSDGIPDFVAGAPDYDGTSLTDNGRVRVIDGSDGSILHNVEGSASGDQCGFSVAWVGDVGGGSPIDTQDGVPDYIMGCPGGDYAEVHSGANGALIEDHVGQTGSDFGYAVAGGKDVLGDTYTGGQYEADGVPDYAIGDPSYVSGSDKIGIVYFISGASNDIVFSKPGEYVASGGELAFGTSIEFLEDLDDDGDSEYAVTSGIAESYGDVFQGGTGTVYRAVCPAGPTCAECNDCSNATFRFAALNDVDGDGTPDYAASTSEANIPSNDSGRVVVYSGDTNPPEEIVAFEGAAEDDDFMYIARISDVDHDGKDDVLAGSSTGYYRVHSSESGNILNQFVDTESGNTCCTAINAAGDVDQDGASDIVIGDSALNSGSGKVKVIAGINMAELPDQDLYVFANIASGPQNNAMVILKVDLDGPSESLVVTLDPETCGHVSFDSAFEHDGNTFYYVTYDFGEESSLLYSIDSATGKCELKGESNVEWISALTKDPITDTVYAAYTHFPGWTLPYDHYFAEIDLSDGQVDTGNAIKVKSSNWVLDGIAFDSFANIVAAGIGGGFIFTYEVDPSAETFSPMCPVEGGADLPCRRWSFPQFGRPDSLAINPNTNETIFIDADTTSPSSNNGIIFYSLETIGMTVDAKELGTIRGNSGYRPLGLTYVPNIQTDPPRPPEEEIAAWLNVVMADPTPTPTP